MKLINWLSVNNVKNRDPIKIKRKWCTTYANDIVPRNYRLPQILITSHEDSKISLMTLFNVIKESDYKNLQSSLPIHSSIALHYILREITKLFFNEMSSLRNRYKNIYVDIQTQTRSQIPPILPCCKISWEVLKYRKSLELCVS